jgi:hypothetical protein
MFYFCRFLSLTLVLPFGCPAISAQEMPLPGALEVRSRVTIAGKQEKLVRKRFYLFRGGLEENKTLVEKLKATDFISRDCFYTRLKASAQFICWLKTNNCESPYCRKVTKEDIESVPEFQAAYQKGLRQFRRPEIAQGWLTTNLLPDLREGFYLEQKSMLAGLLGDLRPLQSAMTDTTSIKASFIDIALNLGGKKSEKFLVSNLLPVEVGDKSYIWACEVEIEPGKTAKLPLQVPKKTGCEIIIKNLPACAAGSCDQK